MQLEAGFPRIDGLANNAGGIFGERGRTHDGFEKARELDRRFHDKDLSAVALHPDNVARTG
jgi:hypothetical protein